MENLTNSGKSIYQECPRKFKIMYEDGFRPVKENENFTVGKLIHRELEAFFTKTPSTEPLKDDFRGVMVRELMTGYAKHWPITEEIVGCEKEFAIPLINPRTHAASKTFMLAGKIDVLLPSKIMEHKSTSDDVSAPEAEYWLKLTIDPQVTGYFLGAESLGYKPEKIIYDVIGKPGIKPLKATPVEARKFTKAGALYAAQRETDETPDEYGLRLRADIEERPDRYFQRREIVRTESDIIEYLEDMWSVAKLIMESRNENFWPRRPSQCFNMGKCPFYQVCSKMATLDDPTLFYKTEKKNEELTI